MTLKKLLASKFPPLVFLDADVLVPLVLRIILTRAASQDFFDLRLSEDILREVWNSLVRQRTKKGKTFSILPPDKANAVCKKLKDDFPVAKMEEYADCLNGLKNDPKDQHVVAVALAYWAQLIVTGNIKHFKDIPKRVLAVSIDDFLCALLDHRPIDFMLILLDQIGEEHKPNNLEEMLQNRLKFGKNPKFPDRFIEALKKCFSSRSRNPALAKIRRHPAVHAFFQHLVH
jgi:predicted nucleic acid-binding protein